MEPAQVIVHEYGHFEVDSLTHALITSRMAEADPRHTQAKQYSDIESKKYVDRRLRDDFSRALYPLIQTEKFEYWLMDEFARSRPFGFMDFDR